MVSACLLYAMFDVSHCNEYVVTWINADFQTFTRYISMQFQGKIGKFSFKRLQLKSHKLNGGNYMLRYIKI